MASMKLMRSRAPPPPLVMGCRLAGRGLQALRGQMGQMATRGVTRQDLQNEQMDGGDGIEQARAPLVADLAAQGKKRGGASRVARSVFMCLSASVTMPTILSLLSVRFRDPTIVQEMLHSAISLTFPVPMSWDYPNAIRG